MDAWSTTRRALSLAALCLLAAACGCSDPPVAPPPDATTADRPDASVDGDAAPDAPAVPRCDFPDGGPSTATLQRGRNNTYGLCNFCHQDSMPGAGTFSGQLMPRPRTMAYGANLTPDPDTGIGRRSDEQVLGAIRHGVGADGRRLCEMVPFNSEQLDDETLCAVLAYLRTLDPVRRQIPASTCTR